MDFTKASPYLENIIIKQTENSEDAFESKPKISVSGGLPLSQFNKIYGGNHSGEFSRINELSVPIGLVLYEEHAPIIQAKYDGYDADSDSETSYRDDKTKNYLENMEMFLVTMCKNTSPKNHKKGKNLTRKLVSK